MSTVHHYIEHNIREMQEVAQTVAFKFHIDRHDLFQDGAVLALRFADNYKDDKGLKGFLGWWYRICHNQAINRYRKNAVLPEHIDIDIAPHGINYAHDRLDHRQKLAAVYHHLRRSTSRRNCHVMYMFSRGHKMHEIAEKLRMPLGTVKISIHRCRQILQKI